MGWGMAIEFESGRPGAEPTRVPPPTTTMDHVLGVGRNRGPIEIGAVTHQCEVGAGPPEPVTGFLIH